MKKLKNYHAQVWDEPLAMQLGVSGRRGAILPAIEAEIVQRVGKKL